MRRPTRLALASVLMAGFAALPVRAQGVPDRALTLAYGTMAFDASGTGSAAVVSLSASRTLPWRWLAVEATAAYAGLDEQFQSSPTRFGLAEVQGQLQWPTARIRPYLGFGAGVAHYFTNAGSRDALEPAVSVGAGLRAGLGDAWGLRLDGRIRGWHFSQEAPDWAVNMSGELTAGLSRRF